MIDRVDKRLANFVATLSDECDAVVRSEAVLAKDVFDGNGGLLLMLSARVEGLECGRTSSWASRRTSDV